MANFPRRQDPRQKQTDVDSEVSGDLAVLPRQIVVLASEWLFVKDLLTLRVVDTTFCAISKDRGLWNGISSHLWSRALVGRDDASYGRVEPCKGVPLQKGNEAGVCIGNQYHGNKQTVHHVKANGRRRSYFAAIRAHH